MGQIIYHGKLQITNIIKNKIFLGEITTKTSWEN